MATIYSTVAFALLAQEFRTGTYASLLIMACGTFLAGICVPLLVYSQTYISGIYYYFH